MLAALPNVAEAVRASRFDLGMAPWQEVRIKADLQPNTFTLRNWDGVPALEVKSATSISLLARPLEVDLQRTPVRCWWIDAPLKSADVTQRSGNDYAARLYMSLALPESEKSPGLRAQLRIPRTIWGPSVPDAAVNYVLDNRQPADTERPNAYTDRPAMVVLLSSAADTGAWVQERRNVGRDVTWFWGTLARPMQLAVTADTNNAGESARAGFA